MGQTTDDRGRCPDCGGELELGMARVHGTPLGCLFFGLSHQHLWWYGGDSGRDRELIVASSSSRRARRCARCGLVCIGGRDA